MEEEDFYTVDKAAQALRVTPERIRQMLEDGELVGIPPEDSGGEWRIRMRGHPKRPVDVTPTPPPPMESPEEPPVEVEEPPSVEGADEEAPEAADTTGTARGEEAEGDREPTAPSGWVSTQQAARALGISPRTVRWHIEQGNLVAKPEGEGVKRAWLVSIDSLHAFRDTRQAAGEIPRTRRIAPEDAEITTETTGNPIRELADRLAEEAAKAAEFRVRLELTEQAQSTLREELSEERRRREETERERDELRRRLLESRREPPDKPTEAAEPDIRKETTQTRAEAQEGSETRRDPWWKRWFGG